MDVNLPLLLILIALCPSLFCSVENPEVAVEQGKLSGLPFTSRNGTKYYGFLGIPFAKPPIGELRFEVNISLYVTVRGIPREFFIPAFILQPPQPPESWEGVRDATKQPSICVQKDTLTIFEEQSRIQGAEDCLYLNVFKPASAVSFNVLTLIPRRNFFS